MIYTRLRRARHRLCDDPITADEIKSAITSLEYGKAAGTDDIPPEFVMNPKGIDYLEGLCELFNHIFQSGRFPKAWKSDRRLPIPKKGSKIKAPNYRLIAIHSVFRKLFGKISDARIRSFVSLEDAQNGFRRGRRCTDHALVLRDLIRSNYRSRRGSELHVLILDFSKAFDRCHIPTLLRKLSEKGVRGRLLRIIASMYTGAEARLQINGQLGQAFRVTRGVAQGYVLSPLFFDIYLDDLLKRFCESALGIPVGRTVWNAFSFADDLALVAPGRETLKRYLQMLNSWCDENFFLINPGKSGVLSAGRYDPEAEQGVSYFDEENEDFSVGGQPLRSFTQFKYLGFDLTCDGSWDVYLRRIVQSARAVLARHWGFLSSYHIPFALRLRIGEALVLSRISYGEEVIPLTGAQTQLQ